MVSAMSLPKLPPRTEELIRSAVWDGEKWKEVKNLGWLINNWKGVELIDVRKYKGSVRNGPGLRDDALLVAHMRDGKVYATPFASREVLAHWLNRPVFKGANVVWFGRRTTVGQ